jgi:hypothetical protein
MSVLLVIINNVALSFARKLKAAHVTEMDQLKEKASATDKTVSSVHEAE